MRISFLGNDEGNIMLLAVVLITILSLLFLSFTPRIAAMHRLAVIEREKALLNISTANQEVKEKYDLH
ncbi:MAG: hypothetical protein JZU65_22385 [Chlorobium sp.]|nr:hypothetical protein [Chlorobium sp.]